MKQHSKLIIHNRLKFKLFKYSYTLFSKLTFFSLGTDKKNNHHKRRVEKAIFQLFCAHVQSTLINKDNI